MVRHFFPSMLVIGLVGVSCLGLANAQQSPPSLLPLPTLRSGPDPNQIQAQLLPNSLPMADEAEVHRLAERIDNDDDWANGFFDVEGPSDTDRDEKPQSLTLELPPSLEEASPMVEQASPQMTGWVRWLLLRNLPPNYEDKRKWGKQKEIFDGWDFEREGLKIETRRKYKKVNHGTWSRYFIEWIEPLTTLKINMSEMREIRPSVFAFHLQVEAPLHVFGRISRYQWDAQLISLSADAEAYVKLDLGMELEIRLNPLEIPPMIQLFPRATEGKIEMTQFRLTRLSHFKGPMVKVLSHSLREMVEDRVAEYNDQLVAKVNRMLDKQQDKLKLSTQAWLSQSWLGSNPPNPPSSANP